MRWGRVFPGREECFGVILDTMEWDRVVVGWGGVGVGRVG